MARSTVSRRVPVHPLVSVHIYVEIDPATCFLQYSTYTTSGLSDLFVDVAGINTGAFLDIQVTPSGVITERCDGGGCSKSFDVSIIVTRVFGVLGVTYRRDPYTVTAQFKTSCMEQCCEE